MLEVALLQLAQSAVGFLIGKTMEGALQSAGSDGYKNLIERLKGLFSYKFAGQRELAEVQKNPKSLINLVAQEAAKDNRFKEDLENLVAQLQKVYEGEKPATQSSNVGSVVNSSVEDSDVVGNSFEGIRVDNAQGPINIGSKTESSFRLW